MYDSIKRRRVSASTSSMGQKEDEGGIDFDIDINCVNQAMFKEVDLISQETDEGVKDSGFISNYDGDNASKQRSINSYGISIDTSEIASVSLENQGNELRDLDVDVYEHDQFEDGIIKQVDFALATAESEFRKNITKKQIEQIESEIIIAKSEKADIDKVFSSANKEASFSLLQQKQSKEKLLTRLEKKLNDLKEAEHDLENLQNETRLKDCNSSGTVSDSLRLGEITPFDALEQQNISIHPPKLKPFKSKKIFSRQSEGFDQCKNMDIDNDGDDDDDDDYVPVQNNMENLEDSSIDSDDIDDTKVNDDDCIPCKNTKKRKKDSVNRKSRYLQDLRDPKRKKAVDDGNFKLFKERMQKLQVKEKLKAACKSGEVMEEYDSNDFSSDDDNDSDVTVHDNFILPKKVWDKLYKYQRVCVKWLWQLHCQEVGGIVGDEMGLGKTVEVIAFLVGLTYSKKQQVVDKRKYGLGPVLIVCPTSVMHHWVTEIHIWWPKFRVAILHQSGSFVGKKETLIKAINNHPGILITSYTTLNVLKKELYRYYWHYVILDEGHKIRNPDSLCTLAAKQFDTPHRIILTGTPMQNNLKELWSLFDFVYPGRLGTLPVFMTQFSAPILRGGYATASSVEVQTACRCATVLRDSISPYIIRRFKKDVKKAISLPAKSEQVLFCKLTEEQTKMYKEYLKSREVQDMVFGSLKIFVGLIKLRKICNHPDLILMKSEMSKNKVKPDEKWDYDSNSLTVDSSLPTDYGKIESSGKMIVVKNLLKMWREQGHRVLLFTQSKMMLDILVNFVKSEGYTYLQIDGKSSISGRQPLVKKFNEDKSIFVFILTTRVGGLGLNLIGANRVVIYDPDWNPSTDAQARERSWRIGQENDVTIYRLLTIGTIEEKIYHRQIFKQFLTKRVLTNPFQRRFFKSNDLYELFTLGDVGPKQRTETSDIFAGTGSQIKLGKKRKKNSENKMLPVEESSTMSPELITSGQETNDIQKEENLKEPSKLCITTSKDDTHLSKKKKKRTKRKSVKVDGVKLRNVEKAEEFRKNDKNENDAKEDITTEDDILLSLYKSAGIHSALKHDCIEHADEPDRLLVEKEAERVAHAALEKLKESRAECKKNGLSVPTWTGTGTKPRRFGKRKQSLNRTTVSTIEKKKSPIQKESSIDISSSTLLARMKNRNSGMLNNVNQADPLMSDTPEPPADVLARDIQDYLAQRLDGSASSDEITLFFKDRLKPDENVLFKQLLKQCAALKNGIWKLRPGFL